MKRFTFYRKQLLLAGMCLLGLSANAQYSASVSKEWDKDYKNVAADFKLSEVAKTLDTDTATLVSALNAWQTAGTNGTTAMFRTAQKSGDYATNYTGNFGEFWMDQEGEVQSYGSSAVFFAGNSWDANEDRYSVYLGNYPDTLKMGATIQHQFALVYNDKKATFDITFTVTPSTVVEVTIPDPASVLASAQNVVASQSVDLQRTNMQGYDATTVEFLAQPIADALGIDLNTLSQGLSTMLYMQRIDSLGVRMDSISNSYTASAPGFWMKNTVYPQGHEQQGEKSGLLGLASYGSDDALFAEFGFNEAGDSIYANVGQYPGNCKVGDKYVADLYIIYDSKAYKFTFNTEIIKAETESITDFNVVGTMNVDINIATDESAYTNHKTTIDLTPITTALGVSTDALAIKAAADDESFYVGNTANQEGFWFDGSGYVCNWGTDATTTCVENATSGQYDIYNCMLANDPTSDMIGTSYTDKIYFINGSDAYVVNFIFHIVAPTLVNQKEWEIVAKRPVALQIIPAASGYNETTPDYTFSPDQISELIGTSEPTMYVSLADSLQTDSIIYAAASRYECTPAPGAWLGEYGQGAGWGNNARVGICYSLSTGKFTVFQMDGQYAPEVGTSYTAPLFFINEDTHKIVEMDVTIQWVSSIQEITIVGSENVNGIIVSMDDSQTAIDLTKAAEALNVSVSDLLASGSYYFSCMAGASWIDAVNATEGYSFNFDGSANTSGKGDYSLSLSDDGTKLLISCSPEIEDEATFKSQAVIGFRVGNDVYAYYVTLMTETSYQAGINNVNAAAKSGKMYNIAGQRIANAQKGIFIMDGKKYIK